MFHAFAHTCHGEKGHQFYYHTACQRAIESIGLIYHAYIPKEHVLPEIPNNWFLHFPKPYSRSAKKDYLIASYALFKHAIGPRLFFIETIMRRDMRYFSLGALRHGRKEDKICMLFRDNNIFKNQRDKWEIKFFLMLLKKKFGPNLALFTDTDNLTAFFEQEVKLPFYTLPIPHYDLAPIHVENEKLMVLFPGEPRKEKGGELIRKLVADPSYPDIQLACSASLQVGHLHFGNALPRIEYLDWLKRSDVVLLPYEAHKYRFRSSGIFVESIALGKVTLVPDGCWMADELKKYQLEEFVVDFEMAHFLDHMKKLCENLSLREKLKIMQENYLNEHTPETFARKLHEVVYRQSS